MEAAWPKSSLVSIRQAVHVPKYACGPSASRLTCDGTGFLYSAMRSDAWHWIQLDSTLTCLACIRSPLCPPTENCFYPRGTDMCICGNRICDTRKGLYSEESLPQLSSPRLAMKKSAKQKFQGMSRNSKLIWPLGKKGMTIDYWLFILQDMHKI